MVVLIVPFLLLELYLSLSVGEHIGFMWSALWIVASMMLGFRLLQSSPLSMLGNINAVKSGKLSMKNFQNAATSYLAAAILLIIPGVLSDFLGLIALVYTFYLQFIAKITPESANNNFKKQGDDNVIDVEIIDE
ncbi:hypothetical protein MNB_SV-3-1093 [hydrothermal vent metagenome]|uniref:FxsA protein n=1 Tax=hydrothermal vent metagenome TaxID=652676 RepID=A0A1W1C7L3_9ZZZZ